MYFDLEGTIVSIGAATYPDDGYTAAELLELADRRLHRRKNAADAGKPRLSASLASRTALTLMAAAQL